MAVVKAAEGEGEHSKTSSWCGSWGLVCLFYGLSLRDVAAERAAVGISGLLQS